MAITVRRRPKSIRLDDNPISGVCSITELSLGAGYESLALLGPPGVFADGDIVYIENTYDAYTGFWTLSDQGSGYVLLREEEPNIIDALNYAALYIRDADITITRQIKNTPPDPDLPMIWSSVHLPIVYLLNNNLSPNFVSAATIVSFTNNNGYVRLTLNTGVVSNELDWIQITDSDLDGTYQVLTIHSATQYTINMPYSLAFSIPYVFLGAVVRRYYNNYHMKVRIYAGLPTSEPYAKMKPYELIQELDLSPDAKGYVSVNVADAIKQKMDIRRNRPNSNTEPLDLDRFTAFYIEYAEAYDEAGEAYVSSYTSDQSNFEGYAMDAMMEFKSLYGGLLGVYTPAHYPPLLFTVKPLKIAERPVVFVGHYFDMTAMMFTSDELDEIGLAASPRTLEIDRTAYDQYGNNIGFTTTSIPYCGGGPIRIPITAADGEASLLISAQYFDGSTGYTWVTPITIDVKNDCHSEEIYLTWKNALGGFEYWLFTGLKDYAVEITDAQERSVNVLGNNSIPFVADNPSDPGFYRGSGLDWDKSYGHFADSMTFEASRSSFRKMVVRSQNLTVAQLTYISTIKSSPLVQQMTSKYDRRTMIVDKSSFTIRGDADKNALTIEFTIRETNDIPSQSL